MKNKIFTLALASTTLLATAAWSANDLSQLPGYSSYKALPEFTTYLTDNDSAFSFFKRQPGALQTVLESAQLQKDLVSGKTALGDIAKDAAAEDESETDTQRFQKLMDSVDGSGISDTEALDRAAAKELADTVKDGKDKEIKEPGRLGGVVLPPTDHDGPSKPVTLTPRAVVDMNAKPEGGLEKDAKGWPKYLNVPANCAAAESGKNYVHVFQFKDTLWRSGNIQGGAADSFSSPGPMTAATNDTIAPWFAQGGDWFYANATDKEVYAVPFYAGYAGSALALSWINETPPNLLPEFSIAECPGDFTNADEPSGIAGAVHAQLLFDDEYTKKAAGLSGASLEYLQKHRLVPGKRYFMNMRAKDGDACAKAVAYHRENGNTDDLVKRDGADVCAVTVVAHGNNNFYTMGNRPLYSGPCLNRGPYPANYNGITCQENLWRCDNGNPNAVKDIKQVCFDARGQAAEQHFEARCVGGKMHWTQGAGKPAYDGYVCVSSFNGQVAFEDMPVHEVCARHSDGFKRTNQVVTTNGAVVSEQKFTCGFDDKEKVFRWKLTAGPDAIAGQNFKTFWYDKDGNLITSR